MKEKQQETPPELPPIPMQVQQTIINLRDEQNYLKRELAKINQQLDAILAQVGEVEVNVVRVKKGVPPPSP